MTDEGQGAGFIVDLDGFEGPLDLLLMLARSQKLDVRAISILDLVEQYLAFINRAKVLRLELAADYLVMAAWLAYLKSRFLLPQAASDSGPSADELAARLAFQLQRLEALRAGAAQLMARDQKGRDFFARGRPEHMAMRRKTECRLDFMDIIRAYARVRSKDEFRPFALDRDHIFTMEQALERLRGVIGHAQGWGDLTGWLPEGWNNHPMRRKSALAAHFAAVLELAKHGDVELRQSENFAPLHVRSRER